MVGEGTDARLLSVIADANHWNMAALDQRNQLLSDSKFSQNRQKFKNSKHVHAMLTLIPPLSALPSIPSTSSMMRACFLPLATPPWLLAGPRKAVMVRELSWLATW